jgi:hypothetical protein
MNHAYLAAFVAIDIGVLLVVIAAKRYLSDKTAEEKTESDSEGAGTDEA